MNKNFKFQISNFKFRRIVLRHSSLAISVALIALCSLLLASCSETPNEVGNNFFDNVQIDSSVVFSDSAITIRKRIAGGFQRVLLGKSNGYEAVSFLIFDVPKNLDSANIISAVVQLKVNYRMDTNGIFTAPIKTYKMDSVNLAKYRWHNYTSSSYDSLFNLAPHISLTDSIFSFPLDTSFVTQKFYSKLKNGILLTTDLPVFGFASFNNAKAMKPELKLHYKFPSDTSQSNDSISITNGVAFFVANFDSVTNDSLFVQAGVADKLFLKFGFLNDSLPKNTTILKATLHLKTTTAPFLFEKENQTPLIYQQLLYTGADSISGKSFENISTTNFTSFTFDVKEEIQSWVNGKIQYGLIFSSQTESNSFDRFSFYGINASDSLRPRIEILYIKPL